MYSTLLLGPSHAAPTVCVAKHLANVGQHSGVKNVTRSRMLQKSHEPVESNSRTENFPKEAFLCKPQVCLYDLFVLCFRFHVLVFQNCKLHELHFFRFLGIAMFLLFLPHFSVYVCRFTFLFCACFVLSLSQ